MYKACQTLDELQTLIREDKEASGPSASTLNRYPLRFVLFDNFSDCCEFVEHLQTEHGAQVESVDRWIDRDYPDLILSHAELAESISDFVERVAPYDSVIAPFSELARFYDNDEKREFDALVKTIKGIESCPEGFAAHQRVYIPIVGLEGKMDAFREDSQIVIYRLHTNERDLNYRLILTNTADYGVRGLEEKFTVVRNIREWLNIWKNTRQQKTPNIVCQSRSIYAYADFAQPDNAFVYAKCTDAYHFLTEGLQLSFEGVKQEANDGDNWEVLASRIDVSHGFSFSKYVRTTLSVDEVEDHEDFIRLWFQHPTAHERWLLVRYYTQCRVPDPLLTEVLAATEHYGSHEFIERLAMTLPDTAPKQEVRRACLQYAARQGVMLPDAVEGQISRAMTSLPAKVGYESAKRYFTGISRKEREIALKWLGEGHLDAEDVRPFFPDLYHYIKEGVGLTAGVPEWLERYMQVYKRAKLTNTYTPNIAELISQHNADEVKFDTWYNDFKTTYTCLLNRKDIEVIFWIDGLGIEWVPLVKQIVGERRDNQIYLNEVMVARSLLPTCTENNRAYLERLLPAGERLEKIGNLDTLAHQNGNHAPYTFIKEMQVVREAIKEALDRFIGKKIAIVSDHGLTYLSHLRSGLHLGGVESDHHGRVAIRTSKGEATVDASYYRLEDGKTLCALKHESLCDKVPDSQGSHGGCTPEEVLVPIFVISGSPVETNWTAELVTREIDFIRPRVRWNIKNLPTTETPYATYNGERYVLHHVSGTTYETDDLMVEPDVNKVTLHIGMVSQTSSVSISTGIEEDDDLFA